VGVAIAVLLALSPAEIRVPAGVPITFRLASEDPIDHEWIVGTGAPRGAPDRHRRPRQPADGGDDPGLASRTTTVVRRAKPAPVRLPPAATRHTAVGA
jgi:hypothetical protein